MSIIPGTPRELVVALATLVLTTVGGPLTQGVRAGSGADPGASAGVPAVGVAGAAIPDLPMDRSVIVLERSPAAGCQPWRWNRDQTACVIATAAHARAIGGRGIGLTRGREYRYGNELWLEPGISLGAVGDPNLPRPILRGSASARGVMLREGGELRNLDIRGPHYNASPFRVRLHDDWAFKGINAANQNGWSVLGTSVNGFKGTGLLAVMGDNVRVIGSTFAHNGYSGVSLFPHEGYCGTGVEFRDNVLEHNGQDGVDACSSNARYVNNVFRHNGWDGNGGDMNGLLVYAFGIPHTRDIRIIGNAAYGNRENGIRVAGTRLTGVVIEGNRLEDNLHWGLHVGREGGVVERVSAGGNRMARNARGCISPTAQAISAIARGGCGP
jgi:hypothetical protein